MKIIDFIKKHRLEFILGGVIILGIIIDQITKLIVSSNMTYGMRGSIPIIEGVLHITYIHNTGAAFGILKNHRWVFMIISTVAIIGIGIYLFIFCKEGKLFKTGLALIISGGIGNMIDRISLGYVVDMIDFELIDFAIFNVADSFVCVGAGIVALALILSIVKEQREKKEKSENGEEKEAKEEENQ